MNAANFDEIAWHPDPKFIQFAKMDETGDTKTIWDSENPDEVEQAKATFNSLKAKGYIAFHVTGEKGEKGEQMREFDPKARRMIMVPPMKGG